MAKFANGTRPGIKKKKHSAGRDNIHHRKSQPPELEEKKKWFIRMRTQCGALNHIRSAAAKWAEQDSHRDTRGALQGQSLISQ